MSSARHVTWTPAADRLPTPAEYAEGVTIAVVWPDGDVDIVSWGGPNSAATYDVLERHCAGFVPPATARIHWCKTQELRP